MLNSTQERKTPTTEEGFILIDSNYNPLIKKEENEK
jgi:hypothetical protein